MLILNYRNCAMPRPRQDGPTRQIYAAVREDLYLAAKAKAAEMRVPLREFLEQALEMALGVGEPPKPAAVEGREPSVWDDEYIAMQANQPLGAPVELTEDEAAAIARGAFEKR
jgi:hypothetical protein